MREILQDALEASEHVTLLRVFDLEGRPVASAWRGPELPPRPRQPSAPQALTPGTTFDGVEFVPEGPTRVRFTSTMRDDAGPVGTLLVIFEATELLDLTGHYHGLGETGELLVIARDETGSPRTLHPTRHVTEAGSGVLLPRGDGSLAAAAFDEVGATYDGIADYRGERVWAATRFVSETGWGLVVKVDEVEEVRPYAEFEEWLRETAMILTAFAVLAGFGLGLRFALPIQELAEVANRIRGGDLAARAKENREDEVGVLARTFNEMAGELEQQITLLHDFRKFFDVSIDMMCMAGTDGFFKRTNPAFVRELGWTEDELLTRPFFDLVHPDDVAKTQHEVEKLAHGIPTIAFENRFLCRDGRYKLLRWASYPDPDTGMLYAIAHVMGSDRAE
jgi:PAS domain S-box-containing protein